MIKSLTKILTYSLFTLVLAFGALNNDKPPELKADNSLPSGYTRVDYIQATAGVSYIDTGVTTNLSHKFTYSGMVSSEAPSSNYNVLFGALSGGVSYPQLYCTSSAMIAGDAMAFYTSSQAPSLDNILCFSFSVEGGQKSTGVFNGVSATANNAFNYSATLPIHVFGRYQPLAQNNNHTDLIATARFYSFSIYDNTAGAYLCDMIPVIRNSDNAVGMYDRVSNSFKGNANTSGPAFTYGTKLELPNTYSEVEFLQSDGTAYIDSGIVANTTQSIIGRFSTGNNTTSSGQIILGAMNSNFSRAIQVYLDTNGNGGYILGAGYSVSSGYYANSNKTPQSITTQQTFNLYYVNGQPTRFILNGDIFSSTNNVGSDNNTTNPILLFGRSQGSGTHAGLSQNTRIYYTILLDSSNQYLFYGIPCMRKSDGVLGMYDLISKTFKTNSGTNSFTTDGTIYVVNNATDFTTALTNAVSGDYVIIANDITIAEQDFAFASGVNIIQNDHTITPPTVTGYGIHSYWYTNSSYTGATTTTISAGTHYYAKYLTEIAVSTLQELNTALTTATADNVIVLTANITYDSETFTNSSLAVINNISYLKAPARTTPWSFTSWQGNPATLATNTTIHATYTASVSDDTRLDIALETATQYDIIKLTNNITLTSTASNHPYGNVTGNTFTTKTFDEFDMNGYSISSNAHSNWSLGYVFDDWYSTKWTVALGSDDPAENTTYYARFSITINDNSTFTYALNGAYDGDQITLGQNVTPNVNAFTIPSYVTFDQNGKTISAPSKPYYTANGWTQDNGTTLVTSFSAGHSYYANYTPETYTITYASQTGITYTLPADAITSYDYGIGGTLPIPTRTGYSFSGWYTNSNLTGQVYNSISSTDHGNKTFYSSWQKLPENISIANVNVFRNVGDDTTGKQNGIEDMFILFTYKIDWETLPTTPVDQWFTFRLMGTDNTTTLATYNPYPYNDYGYGMGVGYFYFPDASEMEWGGEYQIRIDGNPFAWYSISDLTTVRNIYSSNYSEKISPDDNRRLLSVKMVNIAHLLENDWYVDSDLPYMLVAQENNVTYLTQYGQTYFENSINHLRVFAPDLFLTTIIIPDYSEEKDSENADKASLVNRWRTQYEGTWVQDSFEAIGDLLHIPWRMATSILCMVVWIILSAISARLFGTTDAGFWSGAVVFATGVTMGIMEYTIIGAGALLIALYSLYIIFWRQG